MLMSGDRFARQNRFGPPPEFPLASAYTSIVHHLSGYNMSALASPRLKNMRRAGDALITRKILDLTLQFIN